MTKSFLIYLDFVDPNVTTLDIACDLRIGLWDNDAFYVFVDPFLTYKFNSDIAINDIEIFPIDCQQILNDRICTDWGEIGYFRHDTLVKKAETIVREHKTIDKNCNFRRNHSTRTDTLNFLLSQGDDLTWLSTNDYLCIHIHLIYLS